MMAGPIFRFANQPRRALRHVVAERLPVGVRQAGAGEADEIVEHREAAGTRPVVLRRQPHRDLAHVRIPERVVFQDSRCVLQQDQRAGGTFGALEGHEIDNVMSDG
jgi:hypothetical protein